MFFFVGDDNGTMNTKKKKNKLHSYNVPGEHVNTDEDLPANTHTLSIKILLNRLLKYYTFIVHKRLKF